MKKKAKRFWRYFGPSLVLLEICNYVVLKNNSLLWQIVCFGFLTVNFIIITHLVNIKIRIEQHNARVDAEMKAAKSAAERLTAPATVSVGNVIPAMA